MSKIRNFPGSVNLFGKLCISVMHEEVMGDAMGWLGKKKYERDMKLDWKNMMILNKFCESYKLSLGR